VSLSEPPYLVQIFHHKTAVRMFTFLVILIAVIAILMVLVVLVQSGSGGGLAGIASGGATTQILGSRQAPDFLEKATWTLATAFIVLCVLTNFVSSGSDKVQSVIQQRAQDGQTEQVAPPAPVDAQPAQPPAEDGGSEN